MQEVLKSIAFYNVFAPSTPALFDVDTPFASQSLLIPKTCARAHVDYCAHTTNDATNECARCTRAVCGGHDARLPRRFSAAHAHYLTSRMPGRWGVGRSPRCAVAFVIKHSTGPDDVPGKPSHVHLVVNKRTLRVKKISTKTLRLLNPPSM